jgi:hypothetical protein
MLTNLKRQNQTINAGALLLALQTIEDLFGDEDRAVPRGVANCRPKCVIICCFVIR